MGKSSKKSKAEVAAAAPAPAAAVSVPSAKPAKKGKRVAKELPEKPVSAKKQKRDAEAVVPKTKGDKKKPKKASNEPPPKKKPEPSSSGDMSSSESEEEEPVEKAAVPEKKSAPPVSKNGSAGAFTKIGKPESSSDIESDEEEQTAVSKEKASAAPPKKSGESSDNSSESEFDDQDEGITAKVGPGGKLPASSKYGTLTASKAQESSGEISESESEESESDDDEATDVEMEDAPSANSKDKQTIKSEKKGPKTPSNQSQTSGSKTLFVGNLSFDAGDDEVAEFFKEAGEIVEVRLVKNSDGRFKGYGYVEFATEEAAQKGLEMSGQELFGRAVRLDLAHEKGSYTPQTGKESNSNQKGGKGQSQTAFIRGFDKSLDEDQIRSSLEEHFGSCGEITRVSIPKDFETGGSKGIAYMDFKDEDGFSKALELSGSELGDCTLYVDQAKPRGDGGDGGRSGGRGRGGRHSGGRGGGRFGGRGGRGRGGFGGGGGRGRRGGGRRGRD